MGLGGLHDESLVDVWDNTTAGNSGLDEGIELLVTTDSELQVAGSNAFDLEILGGITSQLKNFSGQVLKDSSWVDSWGSTDAAAGIDSCLEDSVDSADGEL